MSSFLNSPDRPPRLDVMARFDALPASVRQAISVAAFPFTPGIAEVLLRRLGNERRCVAAIEAADKRMLGGVRS